MCLLLAQPDTSAGPPAARATNETRGRHGRHRRRHTPGCTCKTIGKSRIWPTRGGRRHRVG